MLVGRLLPDTNCISINWQRCTTAPEFIHPDSRSDRLEALRSLQGRRLNDAAEYFAALRATLLLAERQVHIIGWDIHSETALVGPSGRRDGCRLGPWIGGLSATAGVLLSSLLLFMIRRFLGHKRLQSLLGARALRVQRRIIGQGVVAVAMIRMVPIAPFSIVNLLAGASQLRLSDFLIGTILGMAPVSSRWPRSARRSRILPGMPHGRRAALG